jgi:hypothetical protein
MNIGSGGIAPHIPILCARLRWVVRFASQSFRSPDKRFPESVDEEAGWAADPVWTFRVTNLPSSQYGEY